MAAAKSTFRLADTSVSPCSESRLSASCCACTSMSSCPAVSCSPMLPSPAWDSPAATPMPCPACTRACLPTATLVSWPLASARLSPLANCRSWPATATRPARPASCAIASPWCGTLPCVVVLPEAASCLAVSSALPSTMPKAAFSCLASGALSSLAVDNAAVWWVTAPWLKDAVSCLACLISAIPAALSPVGTAWPLTASRYVVTSSPACPRTAP